MPGRIVFTIAIILGLSLGTGCMVFGLLGAMSGDDDFAGFAGGGATLIVASAAAAIAYKAGAFQDWYDDEP